MICFVISAKKNCFLFWVWPTIPPFFVQIGPKKTIFKRFYQLFFRTNGFQHKLLILIESPSKFNWKSAKKSKVGVVFEIKFGPN